MRTDFFSPLAEGPANTCQLKQLKKIITLGILDRGFPTGVGGLGAYLKSYTFPYGVL